MIANMRYGSRICMLNAILLVVPISVCQGAVRNDSRVPQELQCTIRFTIYRCYACVAWRAHIALWRPDKFGRSPCKICNSAPIKFEARITIKPPRYIRIDGKSIEAKRWRDIEDLRDIKGLSLVLDETGAWWSSPATRRAGKRRMHLKDVTMPRYPLPIRFAISPEYPAIFLMQQLVDLMGFLGSKMGKEDGRIRISLPSPIEGASGRYATQFEIARDKSKQQTVASILDDEGQVIAKIRQRPDSCEINLMDGFLVRSILTSKRVNEKLDELEQPIPKSVLGLRLSGQHRLIYAPRLNYFPGYKCKISYTKVHGIRLPKHAVIFATYGERVMEVEFSDYHLKFQK